MLKYKGETFSMEKFYFSMMENKNAVQMYQDFMLLKYHFSFWYIETIKFVMMVCR